MRNVQFRAGNFYHVFNRGVDKRQIFMDDHDFLRFYVSLFAFNDADYSGHMGGLEVNDILTSRHGVSGSPLDDRQRILDIGAFILRGNHFHLLLRPLTDTSVSDFLRRVTQGYARYFNLRYERSGALFEGAFKAVLVQRDAQLAHLPRYIHLNALDGLLPQWREGRVADWDGALSVLNHYRWSSHNFFQGQPQLLPVAQPILELGDMYQGRQKYENFLRLWAGGTFVF